MRDPRTAVAFNDDYIFFIVVDGRDSQHSVGMKISQLAAFAKDVLGAKFGISQDGGGSSTMVINGEVVNNTYCNIVDCDRVNSSLRTARPEGEGVDRITNPSNPILPFPLIGGTDQPPPLSADGFPLTEEYYQYSQDALQRLVANGLMMVVVKPKEQTSTFTTSEMVFTTATAQVRLGPGTNYALVSLVDPGNQGIVLEHGLNGVKAKGSNWWKVLLEVGDNEVTGWTTEDTLVPPWLEFIPAVLMLRSSK